MNVSEISMIAIILSAVVNSVLGALWYSPVLFANSWMKAVGKTREEISSGSANLGYALTILASIVTAFTLSLFIHLFNDITIGKGALVGF